MPTKDLKQPASNRAYAEVIYWLSIISALICTIGPFIAIAYANNNYLDPHYLFYAIWKGQTPQQIWELGGGFPGAHFWLDHFGKGDALIQFGIVIGCVSAAPALIAAGLAYLRQKPKERFWALISWVNALIIILAMLGLITMAE